MSIVSVVEASTIVLQRQLEIHRFRLVFETQCQQDSQSLYYNCILLTINPINGAKKNVASRCTAIGRPASVGRPGRSCVN